MSQFEDCTVLTPHEEYGIADSLTTPTFEELLWVAADEMVDDARQTYAGNGDYRSSHLAVSSTLMPVAENEHALEYIRLQVAAGTISAIYESHYKGDVGKIIRPSPSWGVSLEAGGAYYWSEARHGESASLFALAATNCDEVMPDSLPMRMMHAYLMFGLHCRNDAEVADRILLTQSNYTAPDLLGRLGLRNLN